MFNDLTGEDIFIQILKNYNNFVIKYGVCYVVCRHKSGVKYDQYNIIV